MCTKCHCEFMVETTEHGTMIVSANHLYTNRPWLQPRYTLDLETFTQASADQVMGDLDGRPPVQWTCRRKWTCITWK